MGSEPLSWERGPLSGALYPQVDVAPLVEALAAERTGGVWGCAWVITRQTQPLDPLQHLVALLFPPELLANPFPAQQTGPSARLGFSRIYSD